MIVNKTVSVSIQDHYDGPSISISDKELIELVKKGLVKHITIYYERPNTKEEENFFLGNLDVVDIFDDND